jgi:peptide/nickel transport system permease protein
VSFEIAAVSVLIAAGVGSIAGVIAGFLGKWTSAVIMRTTDMLFAIPAILLALIVVAALGAGWRNSAIAIGVGYIPIFVRVVRGPVLTLRESGYVLAGRVLGFSRRRLLFRHILPNVSGILAVQVSLALAWSILADASLSFLGLGPPPPTASLGEMVSQSGSLAQLAWWTLAFPSIAIIVAVIGFNLLGDGLRDAIDPRTRKR